MRRTRVYALVVKVLIASRLKHFFKKVGYGSIEL